MHLIIPFASVHDDAAAKHLQGLKLPHLRQLLSKLSLVDRDIGTEESYSPSHERVLANALGLSSVDGSIPWAAYAASELGLEDADGTDDAAWRWVTLCHADIGTGSMTLQDPRELQVSEAESRQLMRDMQPYFVEDGIALHYVAPTQWLAAGEPLLGIRTASLDRVIGKDLSEWQPQAEQSQKLRRLQNEMQMLLYTHPVNDARSRHKLATINSIWIHGSAAISTPSEGASTNISAPRSLADAALREDWLTWAQAWEQLDTTLCAAMLAKVQAGEAVTLTLCGERSALRYETSAKSGWRRLKDNAKRIFGMQPAYILPREL